MVFPRFVICSGLTVFSCIVRGFPFEGLTGGEILGEGTKVVFSCRLCG